VEVGVVAVLVMEWVKVVEVVVEALEEYYKPQGSPLVRVHRVKEITVVQVEQVTSQLKVMVLPVEVAVVEEPVLSEQTEVVIVEPPLEGMAEMVVLGFPVL